MSFLNAKADRAEKKYLEHEKHVAEEKLKLREEQMSELQSKIEDVGTQDSKRRKSTRRSQSTRHSEG